MKSAAHQDPHDLARFVAAQETVFEQALAELRAGRKRSHWMWFAFPQLEGLGRSGVARRYAIRSLDEAISYLTHPLLGPRLRACAEAVLASGARSARDLLGPPDDLKLRSSMTLFVLAAESERDEGARGAFRAVLDRYYGGELDQRTIELLRR